MTAFDNIFARLAELLDGAEGFPATVQFDLGEAGTIHIDGSSGKISVKPVTAATACTVAMPVETFTRILAGELDETAAFMAGEMRITGEVGLATAISDLIRHQAQVQAAQLESNEIK